MTNSVLGVRNIQHTNGTNAMTIDSSGRIFQPAKPMFAAKGSSDAYITTSPIVWATEDFDVGGMYDNSTGVVTIPVDGVYDLSVQLYVRVDNAEDAYPRLQKSTDSGSNWVNQSYSYLYNQSAGGTIHDTRTMHLLLDLNANDQLRVVFGGSGEYYDAAQESRFSMRLVG